MRTAILQIVPTLYACLIALALSQKIDLQTPQDYLWILGIGVLVSIPLAFSLALYLSLDEALSRFPYASNRHGNVRFILLLDTSTPSLFGSEFTPGVKNRTMDTPVERIV